MFLFSKSKEAGEGEAERREGEPLVLGRVLWLLVKVSGEGEGAGLHW